MNEREYAQKVAELVGGTVVTSRKNGVMITQVTIPKEGIQKLYPVGVFMMAQKSPEWMAGYIRADSAKKEDLPDVKWMLEWEEVKQHLKARLKHRDTEPEVCRSAREYGLDDLMIEPFVEVDIPGGLGAAEIKPEMLNVWNVQAKEVIDIALDNIRNDVVIKDMAEQLGELAAEIGEKYLGELPEDYPQMLIVTNGAKRYGAIAAIFARERLVEHFGTGYTLIPSSLDEMIALNRRGGWEEMNELVREVNRDVLEPTEILSTHIYEIW